MHRSRTQGQTESLNNRNSNSQVESANEVESNNKRCCLVVWRDDQGRRRCKCCCCRINND